MTAHLRQLHDQINRLGKLAKDFTFSDYQHRTIERMLKDIRKTLAWIENPPKPVEPEKPKCPHCVD